MRALGAAVLVVAAMAGCKTSRRPADAAPAPAPAPDAATAAPVVDAAAPALDAAPTAWREAHDLDGDGRPDRIVDEFTGGAHCCYRIGAALSSTGKTTIFPFDMDGGYPRGLDLGQPDRFTVRTRPGSLPELVYEIAVYNGKPEPLDKAWTRTWGVRSHRVALCFAAGKPRASDDTPDLPPCR